MEWVETKGGAYVLGNLLMSLSFIVMLQPYCDHGLLIYSCVRRVAGSLVEGVRIHRSSFRYGGGGDNDGEGEVNVGRGWWW